MSIDRFFTKSLSLGRRLSNALMGEEAPASESDGPLDTLRSLLRAPCDENSKECHELYKKDAGPFLVDRFQRTFRDPKSGREVPITVHFPRGQAPKEGFPVVVLSPGLGAHPQASRYLETHLTSHGYIVVCPSHLGSDWTACLRRSPLGAFSKKELVVRVSEIELALGLLERGKFGEHIRQRANLERMALMGHSFGALTAQAIAGVPVHDPSGTEIPLVNPKFLAFIGMSPYGEAFPAQRLGMTRDGYAKIRRPVLFISGDRDDLWTLGRGSKTHLDPFHWVDSLERYHLLIKDTRHADFSEMFGRIKRRTALLVNSTSTAFLDSYLKDDQAALDYMKSELPFAVAHHQSWAFVGKPEDVPRMLQRPEGEEPNVSRG